MISRKNALVIAALLILGLIFGLTLRGSNQLAQTLAMTSGAIRTAAVATFASNLTQTFSARPSATSTLTPPPTGSATAFMTSSPSPSATPTPSCYRLRWLKDLTIPDGTKMAPGDTFTKSWAVENSGTCAWLKGFVFAFYGGDPMGGSNYSLPHEISPGSRYELSIRMTAPNVIGLVIGSWRMAYNGWYFGDTLTVKIESGELSPTSTP
jgi:hypothetical protein